jgi:hypothetical protein
MVEPMQPMGPMVEPMNPTWLMRPMVQPMQPWGLLLQHGFWGAPSLAPQPFLGMGCCSGRDAPFLDMDSWGLPNPGGACRLGLWVMTSPQEEPLEIVSILCAHLPPSCCRLHNVSSFAETVAYYYDLLFPQVNGLLLPVPWLCRGGLLLWKGGGSNRGFHRPRRQSSFDNDDASKLSYLLISTRIQLLSSAL